MAFWVFCQEPYLFTIAVVKVSGAGSLGEVDVPQVPAYITPLPTKR